MNYSASDDFQLPISAFFKADTRYALKHGESACWAARGDNNTDPEEKCVLHSELGHEDQNIVDGHTMIATHRQGFAGKRVATNVLRDAVFFDVRSFGP